MNEETPLCLIRHGNEYLVLDGSREAYEAVRDHRDQMLNHFGWIPGIVLVACVALMLGAPPGVLLPSMIAAATGVFVYVGCIWMRRAMAVRRWIATQNPEPVRRVDGSHLREMALNAEMVRDFRQLLRSRDGWQGLRADTGVAELEHLRQVLRDCAISPGPASHLRLDSAMRSVEASVDQLCVPLSWTVRDKQHFRSLVATLQADRPSRGPLWTS